MPSEYIMQQHIHWAAVSVSSSVTFDDNLS